MTGQGDVLRCYKLGKGSNRSTVRRHYLQYRKENGIPLRCDNEECCFYSAPLVWNGKALPLNLDHKNGVGRYNHPKNLWLLCPNCDSQQSQTPGGKNKGRVKTDSEGFSILRSKESGLRDYTVIMEPLHLGLDLKGEEED